MFPRKIYSYTDLLFYSLHHKFQDTSQNKQAVRGLKREHFKIIFLSMLVHLTCQINKLFSASTESFSSACLSKITFTSDTKFPVFKLLIRNLFCSSSILSSNVFHSVLKWEIKLKSTLSMKKSYLLRGCMKLNDKREFQNGSLGERTSLLTSLLRCSFFARSLWLLMAAPMAPKFLKMVKIVSKSWRLT